MDYDLLRKNVATIVGEHVAGARRREVVTQAIMDAFTDAIRTIVRESLTDERTNGRDAVS